jgi:uncharacterized protein
MIGAPLRDANFRLRSARASRAGRAALAANNPVRRQGLAVSPKAFQQHSVQRGAGRCTRGRVRSPELMRRILFALLVFLSLQCNAAETLLPKPDRYFNDYAGVVTPGAAQRLNTKLAQFEADTSNQFVVVVYEHMQSDSSIDDYVRRSVNTWDVGQKGKRNGVVLAVFIDDRKMTIQTNYGLEGALPDAICSEIIRNVIGPKFKTKDYEGGLQDGINAVIAATRGEYKGTGRTAAEGRGHDSGAAGLLVFFFVLLMILLAIRASRRFGGYRYTGGGGPFVSGNWGSGGGWSSGSSGGSFGSFVGGGGGSFGGGGASGSW